MDPRAIIMDLLLPLTMDVSISLAPNGQPCSSLALATLQPKSGTFGPARLFKHLQGTSQISTLSSESTWPHSVSSCN